jgi:hypothetical protein
MRNRAAKRRNTIPDGLPFDVHTNPITESAAEIVVQAAQSDMLLVKLRGDVS